MSALARESIAPDAKVAFVNADEFASVDEPSAAPLVGEEDAVVLSAGGTLMVYGDGGAGKTTWTIDMLAHVGCGMPWLGLDVARPLRIAVVENEGPRGPFRQKIARKLASWDGPDWSPNVWFLEEPWAQLDLADAGHRSELAAFLNANSIDLLVLGPLAELGLSGGAAQGGTPAEVTAFVTATFAALRELVDHPLALWIVHHENKGGDVSGAWTRVPDTLVHLFGDGDGKSAVHWRKVRWGSRLHGTTTRLEWDRDTEGFNVIETAAGGARKAPAEAIAIWIRSQGGRATPGAIRDHFDITESTLRSRREELAEHGIDYLGHGRSSEYVDRNVYPAIDPAESTADPAIDPAVYPAPAPRGITRGHDFAGSNGSTMRHPDPAPRDPAIQTAAGSGKRSEQGKSATPHPALPIGRDTPPAGSGSLLSLNDLQELEERHADIAGGAQ